MPDDTTPHGGEALHPLPDRAKIPQPKPGAGEDATREKHSSERDPRPNDRPPLPDEPQRMAADIEDEEADPVVESGPGVAEETGKPSVTQQPAK
jgi:hypothetical protein